MNATWKAVLGIILIFAIGCICGAIVASLAIGHRAVKVAQGGPVVWAKLIEPRLTRGLDLNDTQKQQINDALVKNLQSRVDLRKTLAPRIQELNRQTLAEIDALLKPDQQQKFLENYSTFHARMGKFFNTGSVDALATPAPSGTVGQPAPATPPARQ